MSTPFEIAALLSKSTRQLSEAGRLFTLSIVSATTLADNGTLTLTFLTPATGQVVIHAIHATAKVAGKLELLSGPTVTAASGTAKTPVNANRTGTPRATGLTLVEQDATITGDGTVIATNAIMAGNFISDTPWLLKASTKYTFRLTNLAGGTSFLGLRVLWSEE